MKIRLQFNIKMTPKVGMKTQLMTNHIKFKQNKRKRRLKLLETPILKFKFQTNSGQRKNKQKSKK